MLLFQRMERLYPSLRVQQQPLGGITKHKAAAALKFMRIATRVGTPGGPCNPSDQIVVRLNDSPHMSSLLCLHVAGARSCASTACRDEALVEGSGAADSCLTTSLISFNRSATPNCEEVLTNPIAKTTTFNRVGTGHIALSMKHTARSTENDGQYPPVGV